MPDAYEKILAGAASNDSDYEPLIQRHAQTYGVDPDFARRVVSQESRGKRNARSPKGAQGLMQLMPDTAREMGVTDPYDPDQNIAGGIKYLKRQLDEFKDPKLALAAYNAGPGAVRKYKGVPPFRETRDYVSRIGGDYSGTGYLPQGQQDIYSRLLSGSPAAPAQPATSAPLNTSSSAAQTATPSLSRRERRRQRQGQPAQPIDVAAIVKAQTDELARQGIGYLQADGPQLLTSNSRQPATQAITRGVAAGRASSERAARNLIGSQRTYSEYGNYTEPLEVTISRKGRELSENIANARTLGEAAQYDPEAAAVLAEQQGRVGEEQSERERKVRIANLSFWDKTKENAKQVVSAVTSIPADVAQTGSQIQTLLPSALDRVIGGVTGRKPMRELDEYLKSQGYKGNPLYDPEANPFYAAGGATKEKVASTLNINPDYAQELVPQVVNGLTQVAVQVATGVGATKALKSAPGVGKWIGLALAGSQTAQQGYVQARQYGASLDEARIAGLLNGLITVATEKVPMDEFIENALHARNISKGFKRYLTDMGRAYASGALKEGAQEGSEQLLQGLANTATYGAPLPTGKEIWQAAKIGGLVGGVAGAGSYAGGELMNRGTEPTESQGEPNAVWRGPEGDQPVTVTGPPEKGPDGKRYVGIAESGMRVPQEQIVPSENARVVQLNDRVSDPVPMHVIGEVNGELILRNPDGDILTVPPREVSDYVSPETTTTQPKETPNETLEPTSAVPQTTSRGVGTAPSISRINVPPPSVPESTETLNAQVQSMRDGLRDAVLVTDGETMPTIPPKYVATKTQAGIFIHDPKNVSPAEIRQAAKRGTYTDLLGIVDPTANLESGPAVAAVDRSGNEIQAVAVNPNSAQPQRERLAEMYPSASVVDTTVEDVTAARQAPQAREPWQMTRAQYVSTVNPGAIRIAANERPNVSSDDLEGMAEGRMVATHKLQSGETVHILQSEDEGYYATIGDATVGYINELPNGDVDMTVATDFQRRGIGSILNAAFRTANPFKKSGGLTESGEATVGRTHKSFVERALKAGKQVPAEVLADYPDLQEKANVPTPTEATPTTDRPLPTQNQATGTPVGNMDAPRSEGYTPLKDKIERILAGESPEAARRTSDEPDTIDRLLAEPPHHSELQPRRQRNVATGKRGQFAKGKVEPESLKMADEEDYRGEHTAPMRDSGSPLYDLTNSLKMADVKQTETSAFRKWFGGSKVVDEKGEPLVVYHGTQSNISEFTPSRGGEYGSGIYFSDDSASAAKYAEARSGAANIIPAYLSLQNPYMAKDRGYVRGAGVRRLKAQGYDGIIGTGSTGEKQYIVFDSTQAKSALGNVGTFDPNNPNILKMADTADLRSIKEDTALVPDVKSSVSEATVTISPHAAEIMRRLEGENAASFQARFLNPKERRELVRAFRNGAREMRIAGFDRTDAAKLDKVAADLTQAGRANYRTVVVKVENAPEGAVPHEEQHRGAYLGAIDKAISGWHKPERIAARAKGPAPKAWRELYKDTPQYKNASDALVDAETIAVLSEPDGFKKLGITADEGADFMLDWYDSFAQQNGVVSLRQFRSQTDATIGTIEKVRANQGRQAESKPSDGRLQGVPKESPPAEKGAASSDAAVRDASEVAADAKFANMSESDVRMKNRKFGETLRKWQRPNAEDVGYVPETEAGWLEGVDKILAKGTDEAISEYKRMSPHEALKPVLGVLLADKLGREGRYDEQQKIYREVIELSGSAGARLRATQTVSLDDPAYAPAAAGLLKSKSVGQPLTEQEAKDAYSIAVEGQTARDNQAEIDARIETLEDQKRALETRLREFDSKPEKATSLKAENERLKAQIAKLKEGKPKTKLRHASQKDLLKALEADEQAILAEIRARFQPALKMAEPEDKPDSDPLTRYAELQLLRNLNKGVYGFVELKADIDGLTDGALTEAEIKQIAANAYATIRATPKPRSEETRQSAKNRREFARLMPIEGPPKPDALARAAYGLNPPSEVLHGALLSRTVPSVHEWKRAMKDAYPDADANKTFKASRELLDEARRVVDRQRADTKAQKTLTDEEFIQAREEQREARLRTVQARTNQQRYYRSLTKTRTQKVLDNIQDVLGVPRAILASNDASFGGRQGLISLLTETKVTAKALANALPAYISEKSYADLVEQARLHPNFKIAQRYGAKFSAIGDNPFEAGSEFFASRMAELYPGVKRSERLYTLQGDMTILDNFSKMKEIIDARTDLDAQQKHDAYKSVIDFLNISVGKGNFAHLFGHGGKIEKVLNILGFAPRFRYSRFQALNYLLNPFKLAGLPHGARKIIAKKALRFDLTMLAALAPLALLGLLSLDPEDKEHFMVLRYKDYKFDFLGGLKEPFRLTAGLGAKMAYYAVLAAAGDNRGTLGMARIANEYNPANSSGGLRSFLRSGLSPVGSSIANIYAGTDVAGKPTTLWNEVTRNMFPIIAQQAWDSFTYDRKEQMMHDPDTYAKFKEKMQKVLKGEYNQNLAGTIPQVAAEAVGINTSKYPERPYSAALKTLQYLGGGAARESKDPERSRIERGLRDRLFAGEDFDSLLAEAKGFVRQGVLQDKDVTELAALKGKTRLQYAAGRKDVSDIEKALRFGTAKEKEEIAPLLRSKDARAPDKALRDARPNEGDDEPKSPVRSMGIMESLSYYQSRAASEQTKALREAIIRKASARKQRGTLTAEEESAIEASGVGNVRGVQQSRQRRGRTRDRLPRGATISP